MISGFRNVAFKLSRTIKEKLSPGQNDVVELSDIPANASYNQLNEHPMDLAHLPPLHAYAFLDGCPTPPNPVKVVKPIVYVDDTSGLSPSLFDYIGLNSPRIDRSRVPRNFPNGNSQAEPEPARGRSISPHIVWASSPAVIAGAGTEPIGPNGRVRRPYRIDASAPVPNDIGDTESFCTNQVCLYVTFCIVLVCGVLGGFLAFAIPLVNKDCYSGDTFCNVSSTAGSTTTSLYTTTSLALTRPLTTFATSHYVTVVPTVETATMATTEEIVSIISTETSIALDATSAPELTAPASLATN